MNIRAFTLREIEKIVAEGMLSDEEADILKMLSRKKSVVEISMSMNISIATVARRISGIKDKIRRLDYG